MTQDMTQDMTPALTNLSGLNRAGISAALAAMGIPEKQLKMRTQQVAHWMYHYGVTDITAMTNITKDLRAEMLNWFEVKRPEIAEAQISEDGTRKWLLRLADGHLVEAVYIPEDDRGTLCVSSQVGCTLTCKFCHTGTQRLVRNLTAQEIIQQVLVARDALEEWPSPPEGRLLSNIVFMGMGEPLYNFDKVKLAIEMMTDSAGLSMSRRRITLSTSGVVPEMERCGEETGVNLAVSLHAVNDEMRSEIMPINNKYPLDEVLKACASYPGAANSRRITFEYAMLKGVNDSLDDARELVRLMRQYKIHGKINLIPFNPWPGAPYECSDWKQIRAFSELIFSKGISAPIRMPRGRDIMAACGQLKSASEKKSKAQLLREAANA